MLLWTIGFLMGAGLMIGVFAGLLRNYRELQLAVRINELLWGQMASQGLELKSPEIALLGLAMDVLRGRHEALWRGLHQERLDPERILEEAERRLNIRQN
ncbi:MAG: hypothetical protein KBC95_01295 [Candidatus Peribacteraceae bacterium]|nr:hypothetical protein [Candidatus Peribacteraceae bacterium]